MPLYAPRLECYSFVQLNTENKYKIEPACSAPISLRKHFDSGALEDLQGGVGWTVKRHGREFAEAVTCVIILLIGLHRGRNVD